MKFKKIGVIAVTVLAVGMVAMSGIMKLSGDADGVKMLKPGAWVNTVSI